MGLNNYQFINAKIVNENEIYVSNFFIYKQRIVDKIPKHESYITIDLNGSYVAPGLIDIHIHLDQNQMIQNILKEHLTKGTTSIYAALCTQPLEKLFSNIENVIKVKKNDPFSMIQGLYIEGPFINTSKAGAQVIEGILNPDINILKKILNHCESLLKVMTVAPENPDLDPVIKLLKEQQITPSLGHSLANFDEANRSFELGVSHVTHLFNQMRSFHHRDPGAVLAALFNSEITVELIGDGFHLNNHVVELVKKIKNIDQIIMVSDCLASLDSTNKVPLKNKRGIFIGSKSCMFDIFKNLVKNCKFSIQEAVKVCSINPAKFMQLYPQKGCFAFDGDADLIVFNDQIELNLVIKSGKIVFDQDRSIRNN